MACGNSSRGEASTGWPLAGASSRWADAAMPSACASSATVSGLLLLTLALGMGELAKALVIGAGELGAAGLSGALGSGMEEPGLKSPEPGLKSPEPTFRVRAITVRNEVFHVSRTALLRPSWRRMLALSCLLDCRKLSLPGREVDTFSSPALAFHSSFSLNIAPALKVLTGGSERRRAAMVPSVGLGRRFGAGSGDLEAAPHLCSILFGFDVPAKLLLASDGL